MVNQEQPGAKFVITGDIQPTDIELTLKILAYYCKKSGASIEIGYRRLPDTTETVVTIAREDMTPVIHKLIL